MAREPNAPQVRVPVEVVYVRPGETLTVYLGIPGDDSQVELRVLTDGTREVFLYGDVIRDFSQWSPAT